MNIAGEEQIDPALQQLNQQQTQERSNGQHEKRD
jgi:hypothetical protein